MQLQRQFRGLLSDSQIEPEEMLQSGKMRVPLNANSSDAVVGQTPTGFDSAARYAYGSTPVGKVASIAGLLPSSDGRGFDPSLPENLHSGNYLSALMQVLNVAPTSHLAKLFGR
jgi:hypothetical protein